ncbi:response regulator [Pyxidicoccus parkwayensis]|jgi:CheY-like chemotaxis protein|uniref:Response regulator n=1 Tax=Pyxidicoccus parkwayensis TaxID=2813578 RepID=A0ABX7NUH9_9BACT|nr:response regulator [Pyxidicoccus parkwaysis]QSQ22542.1 response regulator [Pyxidicoccus parkwaysis]
MNTQPNVLLIDDDADLLEIYTFALEEMGCVVTTAHDGLEGLERALALHPDLILTDVHMPRMNGLELCCWLRADERLRGTPLILHSSENAIIAPRGEVFLHKDGDLSRLLAQVRRSLGGGRDGPTLASVA